jgi:hypothetical protein
MHELQLAEKTDFQQNGKAREPFNLSSKLFALCRSRQNMDRKQAFLFSAIRSRSWWRVNKQNNELGSAL